MKEQIADYTPNRPKVYWKQKLQNAANAYFKRERHVRWLLHLWTHQIHYDLTKIPPDSLPILVNNFNRLDLVRAHIGWLRTLEGKKSILIIDNKSTYPPLLTYYDNLAHESDMQVVYLGHNSWRKGAAWVATQLLKKFPKVVVTDPDLLPYPDTPKDLLAHLSRLMDLFPQFNHIGTSLEINDLPEHNPLRERIYMHESNFWKKRLEGADEKVFIAPIDTTFAMYKRGSVIEAYEPALRTDRPYTLKHIDWYQDPQVTTPEYEYYLKTAKAFATWATELKQMFGRSKSN